MAYAMVGIPLGLVMFQSIGERLNKFASVLICRAKRYLRCQRTDATEMNLMLATGMLSSVIITTGAAVFSRYEGWSYFNSFYYCFVTLTTIGFGDYVALQQDQALMRQPGYVALSLVFILFGLAVVAASINLLVLRFMTMNARTPAARTTNCSASHTCSRWTARCWRERKLLAGTAARSAATTPDQLSVCSCTSWARPPVAHMSARASSNHSVRAAGSEGKRPGVTFARQCTLRRSSLLVGLECAARARAATATTARRLWAGTAAHAPARQRRPARSASTLQYFLRKGGGWQRAAFSFLAF
ncbi:Open rectifier potassium channel protein 1, partial [Gryllus bimaculatus]